MAEKDRRTYVRVHDGLTDHPKIIEVGGEAAWLYISALCYSSRQLTDGLVPKRLIRRLTDLSNPEALASALLRVGLLHDGEHDCPRCPAGGSDVYVVHDYLEHQRSASEVAALREKRSAAGQRGGKRSGESRRAASKNEANDEALASDLLKQTRTKTEAETETEREEVLRTSSTARRKASHDAPPRADVERICRALADAVEANGSKRPAITDRWRTSARLLLDKDGRTVEQVLGAIEWSQSSDFWRGVVLSMPKLRDKYDQMRLQAQRGHALAATGTSGPHSSTTDQRVQAALDLAARYAREENA
jgi:general stress protein YciG